MDFGVVVVGWWWGGGVIAHEILGLELKALGPGLDNIFIIYHVLTIETETYLSIIFGIFAQFCPEPEQFS